MFKNLVDIDSNSDQKFNLSSNVKNNTKNKNSKRVNNESDYKNSISQVVLFENIIGYDNIKKIFLFAISSQLPVHILLVGPPGSAKTLFLMECMNLSRSYFTLGSHSTKAGMIDYLFANRPRNLIIDEIEYMPIKN